MSEPAVASLGHKVVASITEGTGKEEEDTKKRPGSPELSRNAKGCVAPNPANAALDQGKGVHLESEGVFFHDRPAFCGFHREKQKPFMPILPPEKGNTPGAKRAEPVEEDKGFL